VGGGNPTIKGTGGGQGQQDQSTGPIPGGRWTVPAVVRNADAAVLTMVRDMPDVPADLKTAYFQAVKAANPGFDIGSELRLPSLAEVRQGTVEPSPVPLPADVIDREVRPRVMGNEGSGANVVPEAPGGGRTVRDQAPAQDIRLRVAEPPPLDVDAEAQRLATAVRAHDFRTIKDVLHGKTNAQQEAIIDAFDELDIADSTQVPLVSAQMHGLDLQGRALNWLQRKVGATRTRENDFRSWLSRVDSVLQSDTALEGLGKAATGRAERQVAEIEAILNNPSGQLEMHDKIYLSIRGWGTYEGGVRHFLESATAVEIQAAEAAWVANERYSDDWSTMKDACYSDLSGIDQDEVVDFLWRGKDNITEWHHKAFNLYRFGDGVSGTEEVPMFALLSEEILGDPTGAALGHLQAASKDLFGKDYNLFGELDAEVRDIVDPAFIRDNWTERLEAVMNRDGGAVKEAKAAYVAHSAGLFMRNQIEWAEMAGILSDNVDPTGQNGPKLEEVEAIFKTEHGRSFQYMPGGENQDMTELLSANKGAEASSLLSVLERGADPTSSP